MTHEQLQSESFKWCWNNYPDLRYLFWMNLNNVPVLSGQSLKIALSRLKALGLVQGVADMSFVGLDGKFNGVEFKVGADKQSKAQRSFEIALLRANASYTIISDLDQFKAFFCELYEVELK